MPRNRQKPARYPIESLLAQVMAQVCDEEVRSPQMREEVAAQQVEDAALELAFQVHDGRMTREELYALTLKVIVSGIRFARDVCGEVPASAGK